MGPAIAFDGEEFQGFNYCNYGDVITVTVTETISFLLLFWQGGHDLSHSLCSIPKSNY